jgi:RNA polymerase sigma factor (sigma-70 family)
MSYTNINSEWEFYYPKVYGYFFRRLDNRLDVEDLTGSVLFQFLDIILDEEKGSRILNKNAYLWKIAHNQLVKFINTRSKNTIFVGLDDNFEIVDEKAEIQKSSYYNYRVENLLLCIKQNLNGVDYNIVNLSLVEDRKSPEVAEILSLSADNVRKRLSRSVSKLKDKCKAVWQS